MTHAYSESYLNDAAENLGDMLVYAVNEIKFPYLIQQNETQIAA